MAKVVLVDDEMTIVQMVGELLRSEGHQVVPFTHTGAALESLAGVSPDLVIASVRLGNGSTFPGALLQKARSLQPPVLVIMITPAGSMETALEVIQRGAYDYLARPFTLNELKLRVQRALSYQAALAENFSLRKQLGTKSQFRGIIGASPKLQEILRLIERVADSENSILIQGPPGTGKELIARSIHLNSRRRLAPFVSVQCNLVPESVLEAELFGLKKGAFPSAHEEESGLLRDADGGTLFLDDVGALSLPLQNRLTQVLLEQRIAPAVEGLPTRVDVRLLAASQEPLESKLAAGNFLHQFYQKISEITVSVPSLRERAEDIPLLVAHFLEGKLHPRLGKPFSLSRTALESCCAYSWPGNVRELENALEHACILAQDSVIQDADLPRTVQKLGPGAGHTPHPEHFAASSDGGMFLRQPRPGTTPVMVDTRRSDLSGPIHELVPLKKFLRDQELSYLHRILAQVGGSKERAAEVLRISLATMYRKLSEQEDTSEVL